jgi:hypothetical protein
LNDKIRTIELVAWGLDSYEFRPSDFNHEKAESLQKLIAQRTPYEANDALCADESALLRALLDLQRSRADLQAEMLGLDWSLGVVDLRRLLAFQRRLSFQPNFVLHADVLPQDWPALVRIAFAPPHLLVYDLVQDTSSYSLHLSSTNPNLHVRVTRDPAAPVMVHAGSPFFEVARYRDRWFLRDGYHRAYTLLQAGICRVPSVVVYAKSLAELGADQPRFFPESVLFSPHPPRVTDFLNDALIVEYSRPRTSKNIRLTIEESLTEYIPGDRS